MELYIYIYHITTKGNDVTCWVEALINPGRGAQGNYEGIKCTWCRRQRGSSIILDEHGLDAQSII